MPKNNRNIVSVGLAATMALIPLATQASDDGENWDDWVNQRLQKNVGTSVQKTQAVKVQPQKRVPIREVQTPQKKKDPISQEEIDEVIAPPRIRVGAVFRYEDDNKGSKKEYCKRDKLAVIARASDVENFDNISEAFYNLETAWHSNKDKYQALDVYVNAVYNGRWNDKDVAQLMFPVLVMMGETVERPNGDLTPKMMKKLFEDTFKRTEKYFFECSVRNMLRDKAYLDKSSASERFAWRKYAGAWDRVSKSNVPYLLGRARSLSQELPSNGHEDGGVIKKWIKGAWDAIKEWTNDRKIVSPPSGAVRQSIKPVGNKGVKTKPQRTGYNPKRHQENGETPFYLNGNNLPVVSRQHANDEYRWISREDIEKKLASRSNNGDLVKA